MEKMTDLQDLLKHEIKDLYSAEEQIIEAMPRMIEKVTNPQLRQALERHLRITEEQLTRLEQVQQLMAQGGEQENNNEEGKEGNNGLFARLMKRRSQGAETGTGGEKCLGMQGLLKEGEKMLGEEMEPTVLDAAIIACAQKIEHYEICGYGTARAYARELNLGQVAELLEQTLDEEYEADDRLTDMAIGRINEEAERGGSSRRSSASSSTGRSNGRSTATKSTASKRAAVAEAASSKRGGNASGRGGAAASASRSTSSSGRGASSGSSSRSASSSTSGRSTGRKTAAKSTTSGRSSSPAPASKTSSTRTGASKSTGRSASTGNTRSAAGSRSGKAPSKAAAAKGGRNSSGGGRTASKGNTRGGSTGRSSGRR
jgi:ferritin-like metal-binding protein YciE